MDTHLELKEETITSAETDDGFSSRVEYVLAQTQKLEVFTARLLLPQFPQFVFQNETDIFIYSITIPT